MYFLMDMEWVKFKGHVCPTQISAIKVDKYWNYIDRLDLLIKPFSPEAEKWDSLAYNGYESDEFINAPTAPSVFRRISNWVRPADTMIWWASDPAITFHILHETFLKEKPTFPITYIAPVVMKETRKLGINKKLTLYNVAESLNIQTPFFEHCSKTDVDIFRAILATLSIDPENSYQLDNKVTNQPIWLLSRPPKMKQVPHAFYYDGKLLHIGSCPNCPTNGKIYGTLKECIGEKLKPCDCCKKEYFEKFEALNEQIILNCHFFFVYRESSHVFHKPDCPFAKRLNFSVLRGAVKYKTCIEHGKRPCQICKPTVYDERPTFQKSNEKGSSIKQSRKNDPEKKSEPSRWNTRNLTHQEKVAIRRQEVAARERTAQIDLTGQEEQDHYTLTRSGFAFFAAVGYNNFHLPGCQKLSQLSNLRGFARFEDATRAGLTPCRLCKPNKKYDIIISVPIYQQKRKEESVEVLDTLCDQYGWTHRIEDKNYYIETPVGKWRLAMDTKPVDVYHINLVKTPGNKQSYHKQHRLFLSMTDTIEYIRRHEDSLLEKK